MRNPLKIIRANRMLDGHETTVRERIAVLIDGDRIARVCSQGELSADDLRGAECIDFPKETLMPGFVDAHTHVQLPGNGTRIEELDRETDEIHLLEAVRNCRIALESGVTTLRDNGGWRMVTFAMKEAIRRNIVVGPDIVACGRPVTSTGGHMWMMGSQADGPDGVRACVRQLVRDGADYIKLVATGGDTPHTFPERRSFTREELAAAVDESHARGKLVGAHVHGVDAINDCISVGVDMLIHCTFLRPDGTMRIDERIAHDIAKKNIWVNINCHSTLRARSLLEQKKREHGLTPAEEIDLQAWSERAKQRIEVGQRLRKAGARFVAGSDSGWPAPFGEFHGELMAQAELGLSPIEALHAGTRDSADALGILDRVGTIETGKLADLILVDGFPDRDISDAAKVVAVFKSGVQVRNASGAALAV
jgi:imidazolonepropionase-like amidohydrolase